MIKKILYFLLSNSPLPWLVYLVVRIPFPRPVRPVLTAILTFYFVNRLKVNLAEAALPLTEYRSVLEFFTRRLKPGARKIVPNDRQILSPVDARIMNYGEIKGDKIVQIKNTHYSLRQLVGSDIAKDYEGGSFITLYLSPRDYHCIHHPVGGEIQHMRFFEGRILPVNPFSLEHFKEVFSRNRRLLLSYKSPHIKMLSCWVGALNVGQMKVFFDENFYRRAPQISLDFPHDGRRVQGMDTHFKVEQGGIAGAFELGSTVILIFPPGAIKWNVIVQDEKFIRVGEVLATLAQSH